MGSLDLLEQILLLPRHQPRYLLQVMVEKKKKKKKILLVTVLVLVLV